MRARSHSPAPLWLAVVAVSALLVGGVLTMFGLNSAAEANDARSSAQLEAGSQHELAVDAERDLGNLRLEAATAGDELQQASDQETRAGGEQQDVRDEIALTQTTLEETEALLPERRAELQAFVGALTAVSETLSANLGTGRQILDARGMQVEAALGGDYGGFNRVQGDINGLAAAANAALTDLDTTLGAMPSVSGNPPLTSPSARFVGLDVELIPPTGAARVEATSSEVIPCKPWGTNGCRYEWTVTFTESNWLSVTIGRVGIRYNERGGGAYWYSESGEWRDVQVEVPAGGSAIYESWVQTDDDGGLGQIIGGTLEFRYEGTDAEGNSISGSLTGVPLERPSG